MIKAKLFVLGTIRELLWTDLEYHRYVNPKTGRCGEIPQGGLVTLSFISDYDDDRLLRWITHSQKDELCTLTEGKIVFYLGDFDGIILFEYKFNDAALIYWKEKFTTIRSRTYDRNNDNLCGYTRSKRDNFGKTLARELGVS